MINKKLLSFDPAAMRYVWRCVLCQWLSLLCNVAFVWALAGIVGVGGVFVVRMLRQVVLVREERAHAPQHEDTFSSVHNCDFVLCHQLFATMSSDELKKQVTIKEIYLS